MVMPLFPVVLKLEGLRVLVVGGGAVAAGKAWSLLEAGAYVRMVAPEVRGTLIHPNLELQRREFDPLDLEDCWLVISAATPEVNRRVAVEARERRTFVIAVDDVSNCTAYGAAVVRRAGVTLGISTEGVAPALSGLLREALDRLLPEELPAWTAVGRSLRENWHRDGVPQAERRPLLLRALNEIYDERPAGKGSR